MVGKDVGVLPLELPELFPFPLAISLGHPAPDDVGFEGHHLVLLSVEAEDEVGVQGSVGIQAGLLEKVRVSEGDSVDCLTINGVSLPFVAVRGGCISGPVVPLPGGIVFMHHDGPC